MIIGTAGHIDHGKTTLVKALTGVDTDRLPEEKARGITIELGYAFMDVPVVDAADRTAAGSPPGSVAGSAAADARIGFIDVPGHERLVHTMLAGATGIDLALLLVAADDGPMPQTLEHLAVLSLLGITRGAVVVTKADRADAARVAEVLAQMAALLAPSALAGAPVFVASAHTGQGVDALRQWLHGQARGHRGRSGAADDGAAFRLAIDRAFTLGGVGTVVTGTVHAGRVAVGDVLQLVPAAAGAPLLRVRSLRAQNTEVAQAHAGQRCAIGLAGIAKDDIHRGQWLVGDGLGHGPGAGTTCATDRLDVRLSLWHAEGKPLRSGTPVQVHLGAAAVTGSVAVLDAGDAIAPGASARAQLVLRAPIGAWRGDRVVLRDASASRTLAGGWVLDPRAPTRYRRTPERLAELDAAALPDRAQRLATRLQAAGQGLDLGAWATAEGLARQQLPALPADALRGDALRPESADAAWALDGARAQALQATALQALASFHARSPEELGPDAARLRRLAAPRLPEPLWRALLARLQADGRVAQRGAFVHLPEHGIRLSATEERIAQKVAPALHSAGFEGAWVRDLARDSGESEALMRTTLARLAQRGELHQVVKDLYYPLATMGSLARLAREVAARPDSGGEVKAAGFRDATGLGRKRAIQILEYFDRVGLLRRVGDSHRLRTDTRLFEAG